MSLSSKILILIGFLALIAVGGIVVYKQFEISARQDAIEKQMVAQKDLGDGITRALAQYATKQDIDNMAKDNNVNLKLIKDDLDKLNASLTAINIVSVTSKRQTGTDVPSTGVTPGESPPPVAATYPDPHGYQQNLQTLRLDEKFSETNVPFGDVGFSAWKDKPWSFDIKQREYKLVTVLGTDDNQRQYAYNKFSINVDGKDHEVKIASSTFKQEYPDPKFSWWNPRLFLTAGGSLSLTQMPVQGSANAGVTLGVMSYGRYKTNPAISGLHLGVVYETGSQKPAAIINPINFNIGGVLPKGLANNTYLGPSVQVDLAGNVLVGGNMSMGF